MSINRVIISGNLTRDAEVRSTKNGSIVTGFGVAVNDRRKNQHTGEWEDWPNFVDCTIFGTRGEKLAAYLAKGTKVAIEGKLRYSSWERDGQRKSKLEVVVDDFEFMSSRHGGQQPAAPAGDPAGAPAYPAQMNDVDAQFAAIPTTLPPMPPSVYDEDIPF